MCCLSNIICSQSGVWFMLETEQTHGCCCYSSLDARLSLVIRNSHSAHQSSPSSPHCQEEM